MDTITHGIVGALAGKALFAGRDVPAEIAANGTSSAISSPTARAAIVACTLGSMFPDMDIFAGPLAHNPLAIMEWHRNITHSAIMLPIWALLLAAVSMPLARWVKWKSPPYLILSAIYGAGIASHILLDLVTNFGTMVWSPLRNSRLAWDWIYILDLTMTSIALVPQLAAWCYRESGQFWLRAFGAWAVLTAGAFGAYLLARTSGYGFPLVFAGWVSAIFAGIIFLPAIKGAGFGWTRATWCRTGLIVLCAYIGLAAVTHKRALADVERFAAEQHLLGDNLAALPLPPSLTHWVGLITTPEGIWRIAFHEPGGIVETRRLYLNSQSLPLIEQAMKLRDVQVYLWFARFPVWRVVPLEEDETAVEITDLRFVREADPFAASDLKKSKIAVSRPGRTGFTFEVLFDAKGQILSHGFKEPE